MIATNIAIDCIELTLQIFHNHLENGRILTPEQLQILVNSIEKTTELIEAHFENEHFLEAYSKTKRFKHLQDSFYIPSKTALYLNIFSAISICFLLFVIYRKFYN